MGGCAQERTVRQEEIRSPDLRLMIIHGGQDTMDIGSITHAPVLSVEPQAVTSTARTENISQNADAPVRRHDSLTLSDEAKRLAQGNAKKPSLAQLKHIRKRRAIRKSVEAEQNRAMSQVARWEEQLLKVRAGEVERMHSMSDEEVRLRAMELEQFKRTEQNQPQWPKLVNRYV